tara:strand:+ start:86 stop:412 length:327 start_codon:yes stop_codon:yes gene_type:complete
MRKIEAQMIEAIRRKQDWKSYKNAQGYPAMEVVHVREHGINYADIYLHANLIATATPDTWDARPCANPNRAMFSEYPTRTTRSRLRALGVNASIKNGAAHIDGMEVTL